MRIGMGCCQRTTKTYQAMFREAMLSSPALKNILDPNPRYHQSPDLWPGTLRFGIPVVPADAMLPKPVVPGAKLLPALGPRKRDVNVMDRTLNFRVSPSCNYSARPVGALKPHLPGRSGSTWLPCCLWHGHTVQPHPTGSSKKTRFADVTESSQQAVVKQVHTMKLNTQRKNGVQEKM